MTLLGAMSAFAGSWQKDEIGYWYQNDDGSYQKDAWMWDNGKCYYFDSRGYMRWDYITSDGYLLGTDGAWMPATAENQDEAYKLFRLYNYGAYYDRARYECSYYMDDFNGDGIQDMLAIEYFPDQILEDSKYDIYRGEGDVSPVDIVIYTIENGGIKAKDRIESCSYTGSDNTAFVNYGGKKIILHAEGGSDTYGQGYVINSDLKFDSLPIAEVIAADEYRLFHGGEDESFWIPMYILDFSVIDFNIVYGNTQGVEASVLSR